jgi:hypothetical protein
MKKLMRLIPVLVLSFLICAPLAANAQKKQPQIKNEVVMKMGDKVHLFHSGTADVKKEICIGDVIPVYRETPAGGSLKVKVVGKVKVLKILDEHYFEAEIVEGDIKVGDIAKKETAACLVQPSK